MASKRREYPAVHPRDRAAWRAWLAAHHQSSDGVWLVYDKKSARPDRLVYSHAVEEALCFGWIDSVLGRIDDARYKQLYSPRKPGAEWSRLNKQRVERLTADGLMTAAGQRAIEAAKQSGGWTRIDHVEALVVPADLAKALARNRKAKAGFDGATRSLKKMYLHRIGSAKRPETRAARIRLVLQWAAARLQPGTRTSAKPSRKTPHKK